MSYFVSRLTRSIGRESKIKHNAGELGANSNNAKTHR